jgi:DNA-binding NarL/FixJ family response regulator
VVSILLVEDHVAMGQMMTRLLQNWEKANVWALVRSAEAALQKLAASANETKAANSGDASLPDLVLVDISLPGMNGIELVAELQRHYPGLPCLMLSGYQEVQCVRHALDAGARGFADKGDVAAIIQAVEQVLDGKIYLSDEMREALTD